MARLLEGLIVAVIFLGILSYIVDLDPHQDLHVPMVVLALVWGLAVRPWLDRRRQERDTRDALAENLYDEELRK